MTGGNRAGNTLLKGVAEGLFEEVTSELGQNKKTDMRRYRKEYSRKKEQHVQRP